MDIARTNNRSFLRRAGVVPASLLAVVVTATLLQGGTEAVAKTAPSATATAQSDPTNTDAGVAVLFGPTATEAEWAVIRYSPNPGLELMFSRLYPQAASQ